MESMEQENIFKTEEQFIDYLNGRHIMQGDYIYSLEAAPFRAKITSIKTWKRNPNRFEIHCKNGLYNYFFLSSFYVLHSLWLSAWEISHFNSDIWNLQKRKK